VDIGFGRRSSANPPLGTRIIETQPMFSRMLFLLLLLPPGAFAQSAQPDPSAMPAHDVHQDLIIGADPYISATRYKGTFGKKSPYDAGIAAIDVYFRNDNERPIRLNIDTIELIISIPGENRQRLGPLAAEDVADRALLKADANPSPRRPFPFPRLSSNSGKGKAWQEMVTSLRSVALGTDVLPPHATTHGFLFFDMNHNFDAVRQSHLYIPDLAFMADNKALFFFEIDLAPAPFK
jgi:hypothetical protein